MSLTKTIQVGQHTWTFEFEKYAKQAGGSVMITSGGTQVLATACAAYQPRPHQSFFPLGVDYCEKLYSSGRIPGGYRKREGRPGDHETLVARVIDRQLRPCFPDGFLNDTVVQCTVMSYQKGFNPIPLAMVGASAALTISDIPFEGPTAALTIGLDAAGDFIINPPQGETGQLDLTVAAKDNSLLMVEASAGFLSEEKMIAAIEFGMEHLKPLLTLQADVAAEIGKPKMQVASHAMDPELMNLVKHHGTADFKQAFAIAAKQPRTRALAETQSKVTDKVITALSATDEDSTPTESNTSTTSDDIASCIEELKHDIVKDLILVQGERIGQRGMDEIRELSSEIGVLKRTHGSSLFTRGETQALASVTLGAMGDRQRYETLYSKDAEDVFMLHYNFPSYSVGEAGMPRSTSRREIGHGALAKKAFLHAMPDMADFGYVIRVVSEVLESNGSSSMATVCATTMALLHAGVHLKEPIAGIAMGMIKGSDHHVILTDILGDEDHLGDMDFKVCGGQSGITALQMDIKIQGITGVMLAEALHKARAARVQILEHMHGTINQPHEISKLAPQIFKLKISPNKVRDIIGPGGKTIKKIIADTGVEIDIEDSGVVSIVAPDTTAAAAAKSMIRHITTDPKPGEIYLGRVTKVVDFGCFVEIKPGVEGLVHISQLEDRRIDKVTDVVDEQDEIMVKVIDIDRQGRLKLSRKEAMGQSPTFNYS